MVITVIALALVPIAFAGGFFAAVFALKTGLRWQIQAQRDELPDLKTPDPKKSKLNTIFSPGILEQIMSGDEPEENDGNRK